MCVPNRLTHIQIYTWLATLTDPGRKHSTHTNTNSTYGLMLFPSLADEDRSPLMENKYVFVYIYIVRIPL